MVHVFGIRHHGPGSTKSLLLALADLAPDCLLIEGPPDANDAIEYVAHPELIPPVALLVYNPSNLKQASYYPFAEFSPEWQAMKYGLEQAIPIEFMDLPRTYAFTLNNQAAEKQTSIDFEVPTLDEDGKIYKDPFGKIAKLAGYEDSERWWEVTFESTENPIAVFKSVLELITELRAAAPTPAYRKLQREAYMRKVIRAAVKKGYQKIAVVCGAWHAPVLDNWAIHKSTTDNQLLKGIKKSKTKATWVPWSYKRLSKQSGYAAGVVSPSWYQLLYEQPDEVVIQWMTKVAHLLRKEDLAASSAHVIEAVRLAETLATVRLLSVPGIAELSEAAVAIFCEGHAAPLDLIERKLIIGESLGEVPAEIPTIPLQQDLNKCIKSARLRKDQTNSELDTVEKALDLRKPSNLAASHLLHRLNILEIPWGTQVAGSKFALGSFKEHWELNWEPDFAIHIIEAGMWGNTVYEAASHFILASREKTDTLAHLTQLIQQALQADLTEIIEELTNHLDDLAAITKDIHHLMEALPTMVNIIRYGSSRNFTTAAVQTVLNNIIPRVCIGLPSICINIDEEASQQLFTKIVSANRAIHTLDNPFFIQRWYQSLTQIINNSQNPLLAGLATRILFDKTHMPAKEATINMQLALSKGHPPLFSAKWIEGFLNGSGLLLIYNEQLWKIVDTWVAALSEERFMEILPILRRTFSEFSAPEKEKMLNLVKQGKKKKRKNQKDVEMINEERAKKMLPTLELILGFSLRMPKHL